MGTDGSPTRRPRVLVFCRPYLLGDFQDNVAPLAQEFDFRFITDGHSPGGVADTRARFYARLAQAPRPAGFTEADEAEIVQRCRLLRNLPPAQSLQMMRAMASVLDEELEQHAPAVVLSHMVDDYVTHVLAELSRRRGLLYVGYAYSYFPGKAQVTQFGHGVALDVREPDEAEVAATLDEISQRTFRQNYLQPEAYTRLRHLSAMLRYRAKQLVFALKAWSQRDPLQTHYACLPYIVERRRWRDFPAATDFHGDWRERLAPGAAHGPLVYFPLGYFPEATLDYWIEDLGVLDYEQRVLEICRELGAQYQVVVKEHLHMLGARSTRFYRAIRDTPGVVSVPPLEFSNDVLARADTVLMGAGSIGVEAFIRGKPIASFGQQSYWFRPARAVGFELGKPRGWPDAIRRSIAQHEPPSSAERFEFLRQCLRSTMRQRRGKVWPICAPDDLRLALRAGCAPAAGAHDGHALVSNSHR